MTMKISSNYIEVSENKVLIDFVVEEIFLANIFIQLNFTDPALISRFSVSLTLTFNRIKKTFQQSILLILFLQVWTLKPLMSQLMKLPRKSRDNKAQKVSYIYFLALKALNKRKNYLVWLIRSVFIFHFIISLLLSSTMNMIWSLLNSMQIILSMPLLNMKFPIHTEFVSGILNDLANLKVLKVNWLNLHFFDFS